MRSIKMALRIFAAFIACMAIEPAFAGTSIRIFSFGEYLGQGQLLIISDADNTIEATVSSNNSIRVHTSFESWDFVFDSPGDGLLLEGVYEGATRYPSQNSTRPGLDAGGDGRGCNKIFGRFVVLEAEYGTGGEVVRFAVDLTLNCEGISAPFVANIRINSDLPHVLETPTASAGRDRIAFERDSVVLDASESVGGNGDIATYQWTQTDGPAVILSSGSSLAPSFEAPDVVGAPIVLTFEVEVVNENSLVDTDIMTVEVRDRSQPRSVLRYDSRAGDSIGRGTSALLTEDDGAFTARSVAGGNRVDLDFDGDDGWGLSMTAHEGLLLTESTDYIVRDGIFKPDLNVSHGGSSCSNRNGTFLVQSFTQGPGANDVDSFSAGFEQTCTNTAAPLFGEIRYQVVLPEANAGSNREVPERVAVVFDYSASTDADGVIVQLQWDQLAGPPVTFDIAADGTATFTHELDDAQLEQLFEFQLSVTDEVGQIDTDRVAVKVIQNNQAPIAADDLIILQQGFSIDLNPLVNDSDVDGQIDVSQLVIIEGPNEGLLVNSTGGFSYIPSSFFTGTTTATYVVYDNDEAESNTATITLEVKPGPFGFSDSVTTESGAPVAIDILANDQAADVPLDPASITILQAPNGGTINVGANGSVTYTPSGTFSGQDFFSYDVADGNGLRTPATNVVVMVTASASQQQAQPAAPATPSAPAAPSTPAPTQAAPQVQQVQQPKVCSDVGAWTGTKSCGGSGSLSPLSFLVLGLAVVRIRRRVKSEAVAD